MTAISSMEHVAAARSCALLAISSRPATAERANVANDDDGGSDSPVRRKKLPPSCAIGL
jgi:hypothetical protein